MTRLGFTVLGSIAITMILAPAAIRGLEIEDSLTADDVEMLDVDGDMVSIGEIRGEKGTLVVFTCNACPWVKRWQKRITALGNEFGKKGIGVIAINANDPKIVPADGYEQMQQRAKELGLEFPYVVDEGGKVASVFGATRTPEAFLFDANGSLVYHGTIDDNAESPEAVQEHYLRDALAALLAGREISRKETKALGCSIKLPAGS